MPSQVGGHGPMLEPQVSTFAFLRSYIWEAQGQGEVNAREYSWFMHQGLGSVLM